MVTILEMTCFSFYYFHYFTTFTYCKHRRILTFTVKYFSYSIFFYHHSESVEFTEFEPFHFRRVRLAGGISDAVYSM